MSLGWGKNKYPACSEKKENLHSDQPRDLRRDIPKKSTLTSEKERMFRI